MKRKKKITNDVSSNNKDSESESITSSSKENIQSSKLKKILTFISVLPLSSFYLALKLSYHIIKIIVYTFFDYVIYFVNHWILNFPERFEEYIISFFNNYIFRGVKYILEQYIISIFSNALNKIKKFLNEVFSEENYEKVVIYIDRAAEVFFDKVIMPFFEKISKYSMKFSHGLWNFTKENSIKAYALSKLLLNTMTIFSLDFFEDVQVAWTGIQWFGINIAQPAASFLEDVLLTLTIRPLAYSIAFFKVLLEKASKLVYNLLICIALAIPSAFALFAAFIYNTFDINAIKHRVHVWMCRWVYLPIWYVVDFLVNYGEKLVIEYIPGAYHALIRFAGLVFSKTYILLGIAYNYLKLGIFYAYQYSEKLFIFIIEYIPYVHKKASIISRDLYHWIKRNIFPWFGTLHVIFYVIPLNISKDIYALVRDYIISQDSFIGRNLRIIIRFAKHVGEATISHMMNMLKVILPHVMTVSKEIMSILQELSSKFYEVIKPICIKEMNYITEWLKKEIPHLGQLIKDLLKELGIKINESTTSLYQSIVNQNKKLHQSYESKKEFNKEFLYKNDKKEN